MVVEHKLGWVQDKEDREYLRSRSVSFDEAAIVFGATYNAPEEFLTDDIIITENQGPMSSCTGHGGSSAVEGCYWVAAGQDKSSRPKQFAPMYAYLVGQEKCGMLGKDDGATITGVVEGLREGCCLKEQFPYPNRYTEQIPPGARQAANQWKIRSHAKLNTPSALMAYQKSGLGAIVIGVTWTTGFQQCNGIVTRSTLRGRKLGGHCMLIWGWDKQGRARLHNSHGTQWGDNGHAWIEQDALEEMMNEQYSEFIGVSDLSGADVARPMADFTAFV